MTRRIRYVVTEALLWLAAALGLISILLVVAAYALNISVILFRTGSMEPTIPTGSAALVREIPASEVDVGDVLTVQRPDRLPVTHRVITIEPGKAPGERVITMQGDANESPDARPYTITEGKVLLGSVPGAAEIVHQLGNPYVLGGITIAAATLVGWAFWPRRQPQSASFDTAQQEASAPETTASDPTTLPVYTVGVLGLFTLVLAPSSGGVIGESTTEHLVHETTRSQYISLTSVYDPATRQHLTPTVESLWDIGITVDAPSAGQGRIGVQSEGDSPLQVSVLGCAQPWQDAPAQAVQRTDACPGGAWSIAEDLVVTPGAQQQWIETFETTNAPWLRLAVSLPTTVEPAAGTVGLRVDVEAAGDEASTTTDVAPTKTSPEQHTAPPADDLARTGVSLAVLVVAAVVSVVLGRWLQSRRTTKHRVQGGELHD